MQTGNKVLNKVLSILSGDDRRQLYWLVLLMLIMAALEVAGIGSVLPFIAAIANIDRVLENSHARLLYELLGSGSKESFILFLGGTVLVLLLARNLFFAAANWMISRVTLMWRHRLSKALLEKYLAQPYVYFLSKNTLELKRNVCNETDRLVTGVVVPGIQVLTSGLITIFIIFLLFAIDLRMALVVTAGLGGSYLALYVLVYRKLSHLSGQSNEIRRAQFKVAGEAFEGVKELKLFGKEAVFLNSYSVLSRRNAELETRGRVISRLPRYAIETLAVSSLLIFVLHLVATGGDLSQWMPVLVVYALSGYRLLPAMQQMFAGLTSIRFNIATLDTLHADFASLIIHREASSVVSERVSRHGRAGAVVLRDVNFRYGTGAGYGLEGLNLTIDNNATVGLVGPTGSGKTTIVDIIMGLLRPLDGELIVNDVRITPDNVRDWQARIGYVPQHICLFDDTVARNIAFGVPDADIDHAAVIRAARLANLHDYIMTTLPDGYDSMLGQRGIRLSGGQRQRIGIARALYRSPDVLVLDEATSALDHVTESVVIEAIQTLAHKLTIIMIAHRLNTVKNCDLIHYIDDGRVVASGTFAELSVSCKHFQNLVNL